MPVSPFLHIHSVSVAQIFNKNSLFIPVALESEGKTIETLGLIDSGAGGKFIDQNFTKEEGLKTKDLENPLVVYNVDGTLNKKGTIRKYVKLPMTINGKKTSERLMVTGLGKLKIILGFPWLNKQNPVIDWKIGMVYFPEKKKINWKRLVESKNPKTSFAEEVDEEEWKNRTINRLDEDETSILLAILTEQIDMDIWINANVMIFLFFFYFTLLFRSSFHFIPFGPHFLPILMSLIHEALLVSLIFLSIFRYDSL